MYSATRAQAQIELSRYLNLFRNTGRSMLRPGGPKLDRGASIFT
jgi:hypothetical protein